MNNHNRSHGHRFSPDSVAHLYGLESADIEKGSTPDFCIWTLPDGTTGHLSINGATQHRVELGRHIRLPLPGLHR